MVGEKSKVRRDINGYIVNIIGSVKDDALQLCQLQAV